MHGSATISVGVAEEPPDGFGPLKAALTGNKIKILLSRIAVLGEVSATPLSDLAEQKRRNELIRYADIRPSDSALNHHPTGSSGTSRDIWGRYTGGQR